MAYRGIPLYNIHTIPVIYGYYLDTGARIVANPLCDVLVECYHQSCLSMQQLFHHQRASRVQVYQQLMPLLKLGVRALQNAHFETGVSASLCRAKCFKIITYCLSMLMLECTFY